MASGIVDSLQLIFNYWWPRFFYEYFRGQSSDGKDAAVVAFAVVLIMVFPLATGRIVLLIG